MNPLDSALSLAARGFFVFPILPKGVGYKDRHGNLQLSDGKHPAVSGWQEWSTRDPEKIRKRWARMPYNIGISTSRFMDDEALVVVDVDVKGKKRGDLAVLELDLQGFSLPVTLEHSTPSAGRHMFYRVPKALKQGSDVLAVGLDIRSKGGYVVAPGSEIDGVPYLQINGHGTPEPAPQWLVDRLGVAKPRSIQVDLPGAVDPARAEERAKEYLKTAPLAVEGQAGDTTTFLVAARLKDFGCTRNQAMWLMDAHWNDRCAPPWGLEQLAEKVANAFDYGKDAPGVSAPEAQFDAVEPEDDGEEPKGNPLAELNKRFAFVLAGDNRPILHETHDEEGRPCVDFLKVEVLHNYFRNVPLQWKDKVKPVSQWWMEWSKRRQFSRVAFVPEGVVPVDVFNLWSGWAVQPRQGDWSLMQTHILNVVCNGSRDLNRYVLGWLALMVQKPGTRAGTALVLRGGKGSGKGTLGDWLIRITGRHGIHVSHARHLTGHFNAHLRESMFLFADESFFAGDKQHESVLKALVTEQELVIEAKGQNAYVQRNCLHVLMASNAEWVVPASADERRYAVLDVSPHRIGDFDYFKQLADERDRGGLEAMLFDLLHHDITDFTVWAVPATKGLLDQKLASLRGAERWLADILTEEGVSETTMGFTSWEPAGLEITRQQAYAAYERLAAKRYREYEPQKATAFWRKVREIIPGIRDKRPGKPGDRSRVVTFPPLVECRAAFEKHVKGEVDWN